MPAKLFPTPQDCEAAFYEALEKSDLEGMMSVWAEDEDVLCIHPGGARVSGHAAIREIWRQMFAGGPRLAVYVGQVMATQAMLITVLLRQPWNPEWQPAEVVSNLGYTAMTLSRAVKELTTAGVGTLRTEGRVRWLHMERTAAQTWERAKPLLRSPTKRRFWARPVAKWQPPHVKLAGLSALARYSMLAEQQWPSYAVSPALWKTATQAGIEVLPEPEPGACEWEVWHYNPALVPNSETVDPLSLTLSLQGNTDERVQLALDELKQHFPW